MDIRTMVLCATTLAVVACGAEVCDAVIVLPCKPTASEKFAARELKHHLDMALGGNLQIVAEDAAPSQGRRLFVGRVKALEDVGVRLSDFKDEERIVKGVRGDIYMAGGELPGLDGKLTNPKHVSACGLAGGGTLYAAYDFLETEMGVKWIWPGPLGEIVPKRPIPPMDGIERRGTEPLVERCLRGDLETFRRITIANRLWGWKDAGNARREVEARRLWLTRNRVGKRRRFEFGHAFTAWPNMYTNHPDYFAMQPSGLRGRFADTAAGAGDNKYYPLCVSNPQVHDLIVRKWSARLKGLKPEEVPPSINCCENDSPGFCTCAGCRAWDAPDPLFEKHAYWNGRIKDVTRADRWIMCRESWGEGAASDEAVPPPQVTDRYVRFYNTVLAKARKVHPLAQVCAYAYSNYSLPPKQTRVDRDVVIGFVPRMMFPYSDAESAAFRADWGGWNRMGAQKMRYRPNYMFSGGNMPYSNARHMAEDMNFAYAHGMIAVDQDSLLGAWSAQAMKNYVAARILRAPDTRYETMLAEFLSAFGEGGEDVRHYCEMLEALNDRMTRKEWGDCGKSNLSIKGTPGGSWKCFTLNVADLYSEDWFAAAGALLDAAQAKTSGVERERVAFLQKGLRDGLLTFRTRVAQKSGDKAAFAAAFKTLTDYRASVEADGVCAWAWFADSEQSHAGWPHVTQRYRKK